MNHRTISLVFAAVSVLLMLFGYVLYEHPEFLGYCAPAYRCLSESMLYGVADPLYLHIRPLPVFFLVLAFVPRDLFRIWAYVFVPLGLIGLALIVGAPPVSHDFGIGLPDRPQMTEAVVRGFVSMSAVFLLGAGLAWKAKK